MAATNYIRGRAFEYRVRDALYKRGAVYVMRAAQSKGKVDLLALWSCDLELKPWVVQCKTGTARMSPADRYSLKDIAAETGVLPVLAQPGKNNRGVQFINLFTNDDLDQSCAGDRL